MLSRPPRFKTCQNVSLYFSDLHFMSVGMLQNTKGNVIGEPWYEIGVIYWYQIEHQSIRSQTLKKRAQIPFFNVPLNHLNNFYEGVSCSLFQKGFDRLGLLKRRVEHRTTSRGMIKTESNLSIHASNYKTFCFLKSGIILPEA